MKMERDKKYQPSVLHFLLKSLWSSASVACRRGQEANQDSLTSLAGTTADGLRRQFLNQQERQRRDPLPR